MKNIIMIDGVPVTIEMSKTGMMNSVYIADYIIDVIPLSKLDSVPSDDIDGKYFIDIFQDCGDYLTQDTISARYDSFHGENYDLDTAIAGIISWL